MMKYIILFFSILACGYCLKITTEDDVSFRIIGGENATITQFPWMVSVRIGSGSNLTTCGGSLIAVNWVLTSAECVKNVDSVVLGFGSESLNSPEQSQYQLSQSFKAHPGFTATFNNNIGLIKLENDVSLAGNVSVIRLPRLAQLTDDFIGTEALLSGFGATTDGGPVSPVMKWITQQTITNVDCAAIYSPVIVDSGVLCSTGSSNSQSACRGDSGSPLVINENGVYTQIGLVSFIPANSCVMGYPIGNTRIAAFLSWINAETGIAIRE